MNIYQKLIEVRKVVPYLKKQNEGYQFKYVSSSQVLANLKAKMDELSLLLIPNITNKNVTQDIYEKPTKDGPKRTVDYFTELEIDFTWVNAENPAEQIVCHWYGQGVDTGGEKGVGKALTYAEKYFMLKFFNIPTDKDDPDAFQDKLDGKDNKASAKAPVKQAVKAPAKDIATADQLKRMFTMAGEAQVDEEKFKEYIYSHYNITSSKELTRPQIEEVFKLLEVKIEAIKEKAESEKIIEGFEDHERELEGAVA